MQRRKDISENENTPKEWDRLYGQEYDFRGGHAVAYQWLYEFMIKNLVVPQKGIVDIGCGNGAGIAQIHKSFNGKCAGLDLSQIAINNNRKSFPGIDFQTYDCNYDSISKNISDSCDVAMSMHVVEHVEDIDFHINEMLRNFKYYVIMVPYQQNWRDRHHLYFFDETSFDKYKPVLVHVVTKQEASAHTSLSNTIIYILEGKNKMDYHNHKEKEEVDSDVETLVNEKKIEEEMSPLKKRKPGGGRKKGSKNKGPAPEHTIAQEGKGRPLTAEIQRVKTQVGEKDVHVEVATPKKEDLIVTNVEVVTKYEYNNPETSEATKEGFRTGYFASSNMTKRHPKLTEDKRLQVDYILKYITPKKVIAAGCAAGDELLAYRLKDVDCIGQDIVDVAYPEFQDGSIVIGELYKEYDSSCDTVQMIDVMQYMEDVVLEKTITFLKETKSIKYLVVILNNKGYEFQINKITQKDLDEMIASDFAKVNDVEDYRLRAIELVRHKPEYQIYGLVPQKMLWIYKRK